MSGIDVLWGGIALSFGLCFGLDLFDLVTKMTESKDVKKRFVGYALIAVFAAFLNWCILF